MMLTVFLQVSEIVCVSALAWPFAPVLLILTSGHNDRVVSLGVRGLNITFQGESDLYEGNMQFSEFFMHAKTEAVCDGNQSRDIRTVSSVQR